MALVLPNSVFIHVPKTGGSWVRAAVKAAGIRAEESGPFDVHDHYGVFDLPAFLVADRFTFGFVRHPVDWIKSRWAWAMLSGFAEKLEYEPAANGHWMAACFSDSFEQFVRNYLRLHPGIATASMLRMLGWHQRGFAWEPSRYVVRFIGRYERLAEDLRDALDRAGESYNPEAFRATPPQRVGAQGAHRDACHLSGGLRAAILRAESTLSTLFGYD